MIYYFSWLKDGLRYIYFLLFKTCVGSCLNCKFKQLQATYAKIIFQIVASRTVCLFGVCTTYYLIFDLQFLDTKKVSTAVHSYFYMENSQASCRHRERKMSNSPARPATIILLVISTSYIVCPSNHNGTITHDMTHHYT